MLSSEEMKFVRSLFAQATAVSTPTTSPSSNDVAPSALSSLPATCSSVGTDIAEMAKY
jgi:hypothetical protein